MKRYEKKGRANKDMLFHLGLQLGVPLLVTLHSLDLRMANVRRSGSGND